MLSFLFGDKIKTALRNGAAIIDVRTVHEYDQGRIRGSINIPSDRIPASIQRIRDIGKPIILVCNSGSRSSNAFRFLKQNGIKQVYYGGNWENVLKKINSL
ncbi:MAG TPA: rhodanese-like domain-containing protein [Chitinophagaceae bacterium]